MSERCRQNGKQCRPCQTALWGIVWSGSALFAETCLSENLGSLRYIYHQHIVSALILLHDQCFASKSFQAGTNSKYVPGTQIFYNSIQKQLTMHIKMEKIGCYQATVSYGDVSLKNGDFNILVLSRKFSTWSLPFYLFLVKIKNCCGMSLINLSNFRKQAS